MGGNGGGVVTLLLGDIGGTNARFELRKVDLKSGATVSEEKPFVKVRSWPHVAASGPCSRSTARAERTAPAAQRAHTAAIGRHELGPHARIYQASFSSASLWRGVRVIARCGACLRVCSST